MRGGARRINSDLVTLVTTDPQEVRAAAAAAAAAAHVDANVDVVA